jgi:hypothetical protein
MTPPRWLLLAHQLPTRKSNARVKTWRRLQQIGAVPTRNSVYVLPNIDECRENFEWIRGEIVALGGEATVFAADALNAEGADAIVTTFQRSRSVEYAAIVRDAKRLLSKLGAKGAGVPSRREYGVRVIRALRQRLTDLEHIDFFDAPARAAAAQAVGALERIVAPANYVEAPLGTTLAVTEFRGRRWVTRPRPGVDRMASAWLIRQFIDPQASFAFVERAAESDVAFDMYVGPFSHRGDLCTFEVLTSEFRLTDSAALQVGQIVHDLDLKDAKYARAEAPTIGRMVDGLRALHADDQALLQHGIDMFDALARSFNVTNEPKSRSTVRRKRPRGKRR